MELAAAVHAWRKQLGISQTGLAERAGVSRRWLNEFEQGKATVELHLVFHLLKALGLAISLTPADPASGPDSPQGSGKEGESKNNAGGDDGIDLDELLSNGHDKPRRS